MRSGVLDFFDLDIPFDVPAEEAIALFRSKGLKPTFSWLDMQQGEHSTAFTVAKMLDVDLLKDVFDSLDMALADGVPFQEWADSLIPTLQAKGWWGRKAVRDPISGQTIVGQLGSAHRLRTIFRTNMQSAYAAGQWEKIEQQAEDAPYLLYDAVDDFRTRPLHASWDGKVLPVTAKWWKTHTPPCGFNCRCGVVQLDDNDLERMGLRPDKEPRFKSDTWENPRTGEKLKIPEGVDPGFGGAAADRVERLQQLLGEKIKALPPAPRAKARKSLKKAPEAAPALSIEEIVRQAEESAANYVVEKGVKAGNKIEYAAVFDEEDGVEILRKRGGRSHVSFNASEVTKIRLAKKPVMYHNHPSSSSLSNADLVFASNSGLSRIVAVGNERTAEYHASEFGDWLKIKKAGVAAGRYIDGKIRPLFEKGELQVEEANALHAHMVNVLIDAVGLVKYEARAIPLELRSALGLTAFYRPAWVKEFKDVYRP